MKKILTLLFLTIFIYSDGLTFEEIEKLKKLYGYSDTDILAEIEAAGGVEKIPGIYVKLKGLGFSKSVIRQMLLNVTVNATALPQRIAKHYKQRMIMPNIRILSIGINTYTDSDAFPTLFAARPDAEDFVKELLSLGVPQQNVELLTDDNATQENIAAAVDRLTKYSETVYVFFSGHGLNIKGSFYFTCHDTQKDDILGTTYAMSMLKEKLSSAQCKHTVIFLDACHSGASKNPRFNTKRKKRPKNPEQPQFEEASLLWDQQGHDNVGNLKKIEKPIFLVMSCGANQVSQQGQGTKNSVFTHYLLEGMRGKADSNSDKIVDALELSEYVRSKVFRQTYKQKPDYTQSRGWQPEHFKKAGLHLSDLINVRRIVRLEVTPESTSCKMRGSLHFTVKGVRANGERYTPKITWKAQHGKIDSNGWYTAPNRKGSDKVIAISQENNEIEKEVYITIKSEELARLEIIPSFAKLKPGEQVQFRVNGYDSSGQLMYNLNNLSWSKSGGELDWNNIYTAGSIPGDYSVTVDSNNDVSARASIEIEHKVMTLSGFTFLYEKTYSCGQTHTVKEYRHDRTGMEFVLIPGGSFIREGNRVTLSSFLMAKYEVTQEVWQGVMGNNPSSFKGGKLPVEDVSWTDSKSFCDKLGLRLPTEAEWEYACRAGTTSDYYCGNLMDGNYAWYSNNSNNKTHEVGQKYPNAFGLYDMMGNVWEWCADWYGTYPNSATTNPQGASSGRFRVYRGGSWDYNAWNCRSANRGYYSPDLRFSNVGFRPCVTWKKLSEK